MARINDFKESLHLQRVGVIYNEVQAADSFQNWGVPCQATCRHTSQGKICIITAVSTSNVPFDFTELFSPSLFNVDLIRKGKFDIGIFSRTHSFS
jgi:hypothetical protein